MNAACARVAPHPSAGSSNPSAPITVKPSARSSECITPSAGASGMPKSANVLIVSSPPKTDW